MPDELTLRQEYYDYLARFETARHVSRATPLTYPEFKEAFARWQREYDPAWRNDDHATMRELEQLLALSRTV